mmetsp:Transcript_156688/g.480734  ORF Transcript_156688/g.480734 Transcript_156688/m.480734 type:complete len:361 (+) Transcript_156688:67-1149(+)
MRGTTALTLLAAAWCAETLRIGDGPARKSRLQIVIPTYVDHFTYYSNFLKSLAGNVLPSAGEACMYDEVFYNIVVSTDEEKQSFGNETRRVVGNLLTRDGQPVFRFFTFSEVIILTTSPSETRVIHEYKDKYAYQSTKKVYGCLAALGLRVGSPDPPRGDLCFALDSDSWLTGNHSLCHTATRYMEKRVVLTSPVVPVYKNVVKASRKLLQGRTGEDFGEFVAVESYHWFWEAPLISRFMRECNFAFDDPRPFPLYIEEAFNHFLYPRREEWGYTFVDTQTALADALGLARFRGMYGYGGGPALELLCEKNADMLDSEMHSVGRLLHKYGVFLSRCEPSDAHRCQVLMKYVDVCVSSPHR